MAVIAEDTARRVVEYPTAHLRVLGPPGSGKTRLLVDRFRALEAREGEKVYIVTYSGENLKRLTRAVCAKNTARSGAPRVLTYSRLAVEVIEAAGGRPPAIVTDLEEHLLLEEVIAGREARLESDLRSICRSARFREDVLGACRVLLQNGVSGRRLGALKKTAPSAEVSDILVLYEGFRGALDAKGAATFYDIAWAALAHGEGFRRHPLSKAAAVLVEDFQDVDAGQFALLEALAPPGGGTALNVFGDPLGSVFARRGTQHGFLMEEFPRRWGGETLYLGAEAPGRGPEEALGEFLEELSRYALSRRGAGGPSRPRPRDAPRAGGGPEHFRIEIVRDEMDEVYAAADGIARLLREGAHRPEDIAIVTNDKRRYEPLLAAAAAQRGVPLDTGREGRSVFVDFAGALLALVDSPDDPIAARAVATSPFIDALLGDQGGARSEGAGEERSRAAADGLRRVVDGVRGAVASSDPSRWMDIVVERCLRPVCDALSRVSGDDAAYGETCRLREAWDRYVSAVSKWGGRPAVGSFAELDAALSRGRRAARGGAVSFLSCREAKGRFFPAVFVLGCSELLFPSAGRSENLLPMTALEEALRRVCPWPADVYRARAAARRLEEEYHLLYIALTRADERLHVTAPRSFDGEDLPAPSAVLERAVPESLRVESDDAGRVPPQIRFARAWVAGAPPRVDPRLERLSGAGFHWRAPRPPETPVAPAPFALSKSSIDAFLKCERQFFYRKVLRIPETDSAAMRMGSLFHKVMAALCDRFPSRAELVASATPEIVRDTVAEALRSDEEISKTPFYERLFRRHLEKLTGKMLDLERSDPENCTIRGTEVPLLYDCGPWKFTGRMDRVHETPSGGKVIVDYKTGKTDKMAKTHRRKILAAPEDPKETNWQVPIYVWGVKTNEGRAPSAFTFMAASAREEPFSVTLFVCRDEADVPPHARKGKAHSYLLESEVEGVMETAVRLAGEIFAPARRFERTQDRSACRTCRFSRLCRREER